MLGRAVAGTAAAAPKEAAGCKPGQVPKKGTKKVACVDFKLPAGTKPAAAPRTAQGELGQLTDQLQTALEGWQNGGKAKVKLTFDDILATCPSAGTVAGRLEASGSLSITHRRQGRGDDGRPRRVGRDDLRGRGGGRRQVVQDRRHHHEDEVLRSFPPGPVKVVFNSRDGTNGLRPTAVDLALSMVTATEDRSVNTMGGGPEHTTARWSLTPGY